MLLEILNYITYMNCWNNFLHAAISQETLLIIFIFKFQSEFPYTVGAIKIVCQCKGKQLVNDTNPACSASWLTVQEGDMWLPSGTNSNFIMMCEKLWNRQVPSSKTYPLFASMKGFPEPNRDVSPYLIHCNVLGSFSQHFYLPWHLICNPRKPESFKYAVA